MLEINGAFFASFPEKPFSWAICPDLNNPDQYIVFLPNKEKVIVKATRAEIIDILTRAGEILIN